MKKPSRREILYQLALAGIASAIALLFVGLSVLVRFSTIAFFIAAGLALMVPLTKKYYLASVFAYIASSALGFLIAGDVYTVAGYIVYFGPMALISGLFFNLKVKWYFQLPIKLAYINGALALLYFVLHTIVINVNAVIPFYLVAIVGSVILICIDFVVQFIYSRLIPIVGKILRNRDEEKKEELDEPDDPFEDDLYTDIHPHPAPDDDNSEEDNEE